MATTNTRSVSSSSSSSSSGGSFRSSGSFRRAFSNSSPQFSNLTEACKSNSLDFVQTAIRQKKPCLPDTLSAACATRNYQIVDLVVKAGAEPDEKTLNIAFASEVEAIVRRVLAKGAKPNTKTFEISLQTAPQRMVDLLALVPFYPTNRSNTSSFTTVCRGRNLDSAFQMTREGLDIDPDDDSLSEAFSSGIWHFVELAESLEAKPNEQSLNRAILGFISDKEKAFKAVDIAIKAKALPTNDTLDIALRHCGELSSPAEFITYLHEKTQAKASENSLTWASLVSLDDHNAYDALLAAVLKIGVIPDEKSFSSIRWVGTLPGTNNLVSLSDATLNALFEGGLRPTEAELEGIKALIVPVATTSSKRTETERHQVVKNEVHQKIVDKANPLVAKK